MLFFMQRQYGRWAAQSEPGATSRLPRPFQDKQVFDVPIGIKIIHAFLLAPRPVESLLVEEDWNLVWIEIHVQYLQMIRLLAVQQTVPRITRTGLCKDLLPVRRTAQH